MKQIVILLFLLSTVYVSGQNSFQKNLYELNSEINNMQKQILEKPLTISLQTQKYELTKSLNRLCEEAMQESVNENLNSEIGDLVSFACELGKQKLNLIEAYKRYNDSFYLKKFNELDTLYLSIYLKLKTKE
jgi:gas vesicle protein